MATKCRLVCSKLGEGSGGLGRLTAVARLYNGSLNEVTRSCWLCQRGKVVECRALMDRIASSQSREHFQSHSLSTKIHTCFRIEERSESRGNKKFH